MDGVAFQFGSHDGYVNAPARVTGKRMGRRRETDKTVRLQRRYGRTALYQCYFEVHLSVCTCATEINRPDYMDG